MRRMKVLGVFLVAGLALAACGKSNSNSSSTTSTTAGSTSTTAPGSGTTAGSSTVSVTPASGDIKAHLVGANGHSLYLFEKDKGTTSACTGGCASIWPALTSSSPTGGTGVDASKLTTATGQVANQVVYNGHLLYYFSGDATSTDTKGTSIADWYLVGADGKAVDNT